MKDVIVSLNEYCSVADLELGKEKSIFSIQVSNELYERYNKAKKEFDAVQILLMNICRENNLII